MKSFHDTLIEEFSQFVAVNLEKSQGPDIIRMDLHCHDHNSNVPDEILGRILGVPETWLTTAQLIKRLTENGCTAFTITNHNNGRSCFDLLDKGFEVVSGAEFSCQVPEFGTGIHVLTYGFDPAQEVRLNELRDNLYSFLDYTLEHSLPTIWAHPLFHYKTTGIPPMEFFDRMALCFERFEVLNGQRDNWQNMLVKRWIDSLTPDKINRLSEKTGIPADRFCKNPYRKSMAGGSDSHMGIFSGLTHTLLDCSGLPANLSKPEMAIEAINEGRMVPCGTHNNSEKMMVSIIDYAFQVVLNSKDPGLLRMFFHKGAPDQKLMAWFLVNSVSELRRHKVTMKFIQVSHDCFRGIAPNKAQRLLVPRDYKPVFDQVKIMAGAFTRNKANPAEIQKESLLEIYEQLKKIVVKRLKEKTANLQNSGITGSLSPNDLIGLIEIPVSLRSYFSRKNKKRPAWGEDGINLSGFLDGLPFPFFASIMILGAISISTKALYNDRILLNRFSEAIDFPPYPDRILWLTDSYGSDEITSRQLAYYLKEMQMNKMKVDLLVCSNEEIEEPNLIVIKPMLDLDIPGLSAKIVIPDFLEIHQLFLKNEYSKVLVSTVGPMGLAGLYLKLAYTVKAGFIEHMDHLGFIRDKWNLDQHNFDRIRRLYRFYIQQFDTVFQVGKHNLDDIIKS